MKMHTSVFLEEAVEALNVQQGKRYIDATFGEGGHARMIKSQGGEVIGIDADRNQAEKESEIKVIHGNYADIEEIVSKEGFVPVDGVLFDFGLSMVQIRSSGRGFTYKVDQEPLDMRLNTQGMTASDYLNTASQEELEEQITRYSEDLSSTAIARNIILFRRRQEIKTVGDLKNIIKDAKRAQGEHLDKTYARIFQAVRIIVNNELTSIEKGLEGAYRILVAGGRIVVISFHSIEDRIVKAFVRSKGLKQQKITVQKNRKLQKFERSATLRIIQKI